MEAIQTYKQYKTECAESLKGNFLFSYATVYTNKIVTNIRHKKKSSQKHFVTKLSGS